MNITDKIKITNEDNMELMKRYPDNYFDLAIVDPPYGIDSKMHRSSHGKVGGGEFEKYSQKRWDKQTPKQEYFNELRRASKNQIIWGGNYFFDYLPSTRGIICWDKEKYVSNFSAWEMAWTSFDVVARIVKHRHHGFLTSDNVKIHPTQKPVALYKWLLDKYAKQGDKILDTHLGSGSIAIACHDYNFELTACELDKEYYDKAIERITNHTKQQKLF
jgi:site-specific DNA-methyltransferase (adenine-specific)